MILNGVERVIAELKIDAEYGGDDAFDCRRRLTARKNLDLIALLQSSIGPEKWIVLHGHLQLGVYHAPSVNEEGKHTIPQVVINESHPAIASEIVYLLNIESRPWEYAKGYAQDVPTAAAMIIDALGRCEQRDEHLYR